MCSIIGWTGELPKGLLSALLVEAESRGRDSTGIAFYLDGNSRGYRQAIPAHAFVKKNNKECGEARRAHFGLAHCRRASRGMPIDNRNAHPYAYGRTFFAHNGSIQNWEDLKKARLATIETQLGNSPTDDEKKGLEARKRYLTAVTTDSMILGPYISQRDFSEVKGSIGLVWMRDDSVYVMRSAKELEATTIIWKPMEKSKEKEDTIHSVTVAASTKRIISDALVSLKNIECEYSWTELAENRLYQLAPDKILDKGPISTNTENSTDTFTSAEVVDEAEVNQEITKLADASGE